MSRNRIILEDPGYVVTCTEATIETNGDLTLAFLSLKLGEEDQDGVADRLSLTPNCWKTLIDSGMRYNELIAVASDFHKLIKKIK